LEEGQGTKPDGEPVPLVGHCQVVEGCPENDQRHPANKERNERLSEN